MRALESKLRKTPTTTETVCFERGLYSLAEWALGGPKSSSLVSQDDLSLDATASAAILGVPLDASIL
jgi:hypothetical protein